MDLSIGQGFEFSYVMRQQMARVALPFAHFKVPGIRPKHCRRCLIVADCIERSFGWRLVCIDPRHFRSPTRAVGFGWYGGTLNLCKKLIITTLKYFVLSCATTQIHDKLKRAEQGNYAAECQSSQLIQTGQFCGGSCAAENNCEIKKSRPTVEPSSSGSMVEGISKRRMSKSSGAVSDIGRIVVHNYFPFFFPPPGLGGGCVPTDFINEPLFAFLVARLGELLLVLAVPEPLLGVFAICIVLIWSCHLGMKVSASRAGGAGAVLININDSFQYRSAILRRYQMGD